MHKLDRTIMFFSFFACDLIYARTKKLGTAGAGPGLSAGPVVATGARPAGAPKSQGTRDPNSKFSDDEVKEGPSLKQTNIKKKHTSTCDIT